MPPWWGDLTSKHLIVLKGILFGVLGSLALLCNLLPEGVWLRLSAAGLMIWAFCRLYYFLFYVLEKYVDPAQKYSGLYALLKRIISAQTR